MIAMTSQNKKASQLNIKSDAYCPVPRTPLKKYADDAIKDNALIRYAMALILPNLVRLRIINEIASIEKIGANIAIDCTRHLLF